MKKKINLIPPNPDSTETTTDVRIMMARHSLADQVVMGQWIEDFLNTPTGDLIVNTISNLRDHAIARRVDKAEAQLGEIQGLASILDVFQQYVIDGRKASAQLKETSQEEEQEDTDLHDPK